MQIKRVFPKNPATYSIEKLQKLNIELMNALFSLKLTDKEKEILFEYAILGGELTKEAKAAVINKLGFKSSGVLDEYNKRLRSKKVLIKVNKKEKIDPKILIPTQIKKFTFELNINVC